MCCWPSAVPHEVAHGSLRLSLCEWNTEEEVDIILQEVPRIVEYLRNMSPHVEGPGQRQEAVHAVIRRQISWHCIPTL